MALTFLFSYLIIGNLEIAGVTTILSIWMFMMPRLTHENSTYKNKLPKFLFKGDLINKILSILIPLIFWIVYAVSMKNATLFENPTFGLLFIIMPIIPAGVQYFVFTHSDSPVDWVSAFATAIFTFFGAEFINMGLGTTISSMFPFLSNSPIIITQLWSILLEILLIYSFYRIISIIIPSRTLSSLATTFVWVFIAMTQKLYISTLGYAFKLSDIFNIKQFIETVKVLFLGNNMPAALIIQGLGITAAVTIAIFMLNKWTTIYDLKERSKGLIVGIAVLAVSIFAFGFTNNYAGKNELTTYKGTGLSLIQTIGQKNESPEIEDKDVEVTAPEGETTTPETTPSETEGNYGQEGQLVPPQSQN